jgi:hypothetical protein
MLDIRYGPINELVDFLTGFYRRGGFQLYVRGYDGVCQMFSPGFNFLGLADI